MPFTLLSQHAKGMELQRLTVGMTPFSRAPVQQGIRHFGKGTGRVAVDKNNVCRRSSFRWHSPSEFVSIPIKYSSQIIIMADSNRSSLITASIPLGNEALEEERFNDLSMNSPINQELDLIEAFEDKYDGVVIDPNNLPLSAPAFVSSLRTSLSSWKHKGKKGVWLKLQIEHAHLVPAAIKEGFKYHHAEPTYVMLTYWIPDGPCLLPSNASHQVGVGSFVINDNREVLAVQENQGFLRGSGVWKIPTGLIHESEDIFTGAIREVKEETGIDTEFLEVIGFRVEAWSSLILVAGVISIGHAHHVLFEKSDLFFICVLQPLSSHIVKDDREIQAAQWMPLEEFAAQPFYQEHSMLKKMLDICTANFEKRYKGFSSFQMYSGCDSNPSYFYYNNRDIK